MTSSLKRESAHHARQLGAHYIGQPGVAMLRVPDVIARTGLSRTTIWRRVQAGTFPAPIQLGENSIGWPESVITEWVENRPMVAYAGQEVSAA